MNFRSNIVFYKYYSLELIDSLWKQNKVNQSTWLRLFMKFGRFLNEQEVHNIFRIYQGRKY